MVAQIVVLSGYINTHHADFSVPMATRNRKQEAEAGNAYSMEFTRRLGCYRNGFCKIRSFQGSDISHLSKCI